MFRILFSGDDSAHIIMQLAAILIAVLVGMTVHEFAHAFAAYKNGDLTAKFMGRMTLNPIKHFDLIGFLMLLVVGFGWAKPVPVDSNNFRHIRKGIFTVSLAGVTANLIVALLSLALLAIQFAIASAVGTTVGTAAFTAFYLFYYIFIYTMSINLTLMAFNLLPIYPLDGFHVLETFLRYDNKYCVFMRRYGSFVLLALLLGSSLLGRISPYLDIVGLYIGAVTSGADWLVSLIFTIL